MQVEGGYSASVSNEIAGQMWSSHPHQPLSGIRRSCESMHNETRKVCELCATWMKLEETLVEVQLDTDVQIVRISCV